MLVVAKPAGPTSHDIVALVRRLAATRRVGHGGTLDPFAAGVLPIFLGHGTRIVEYHLGDRKVYRATVCFGASSTTEDLEGELTPASGPAPDRAAVVAAIAGFLGPITQRPPAYSAIKVGGRRAYALARAGETVVLAERAVTIHAFDLVSWDDTDPDRPVAVVDVDCSAGTYVRAIARDLGAAVGSAAYLGALTRVRSGSFAIEDAVSLDSIREATADGPEGLRVHLRAIDVGLEAFPELVLDAAATQAVARGQFVSVPPGWTSTADHIRLRAPDGSLIAIATAQGGRLAPDKVFISPTPTAAAAPGPV